MQRHPIFRYAVDPCFASKLLVFQLRPADIIQPNPADNPYLEDFIFTALDFRRSRENLHGTLPPSGGIDRLALTGRKDGPTGTRPSAAALDSATALPAAPGIER